MKSNKTLANWIVTRWEDFSTVNRQVDNCGHRKWSQSDQEQTIWGRADANTARSMCADSTAAALWKHTKCEPRITAIGTFLFIQNYSTQCDAYRFNTDGGGQLKCWHRIYKCNVSKHALPLPLNPKNNICFCAGGELVFAKDLSLFSTVFQLTLEPWDQQTDT